MLPAFMDVGAIGSPVDVATFVVVVLTYIHEIRPRVEKVAVAVVALAERSPHVDDDRLAAELEVDDRDVDALRPTIVEQGDS